MAVLVSPLGVPAKPATADSISTLQAKAAQLAAQINTQGNLVNAASEAYDLAGIKVQKVDGQLTAAAAALARTDKAVGALQSHLAVDAVNAYVQQGNTMSSVQMLLQADPTTYVVRKTYLDAVAGDEQSTVDNLHITKRTQQAEQVTLQGTQAQAKAALASAASYKQQAADANRALEATLSQVKGQLTTLVAQAQAAAAAAEAARVKAQVQAQEAAQAAQRAANPAPSPLGGAVQGVIGAVNSVLGGSSGGSGGGSSALPVGNGGASTAISWAQSEVGKPYIYGAAGPDAFDCSGLIQYVWGKAGVYLPHNAAAQWGVTSRVPMGQLQPGDLVFYDGLGHVGLYVGGGQMIVADNEAVPIRYASIYRDGYVGAGRVN